MLFLAAGIGGATGFAGMNLSYHLDVQSGPTIVLVGATLFAAVFVISGGRRLRRVAAQPAQGRTSRRWGRHRCAARRN